MQVIEAVWGWDQQFVSQYILPMKYIIPSLCTKQKSQTNDSHGHVERKSAEGECKIQSMESRENYVKEEN